MFNKNDPLISAVSGVMKENELRRDVEKKLCEELGIYSRKVLPREHQANYDALLEQRLTEALHPNQQKLDVHEPEKDKLTKHDFKMLRAGKKSKEMSEAELAAPETGPRKTSGSNQPIAEEQLDEVSKKTLGSYIKKASHSVAEKSAQVRGHAMKSKEAVDKNDIRTARQEDERSNKAFKKSWKRREGIAKATDKLTKEEVQDSINPLPPAGAKERIQNKLGIQPKSTFTGDSGMAKSKEDRDEMNKKMEKLDEAAKSKAQQRLMGMALAMRRGESDRGSSKVAKIATDMPEKELKKFAKTKRKGLPEKVKKMDENLSIDDVMEEIARNLGEEKMRQVTEQMFKNEAERQQRMAAAKKLETNKKELENRVTNTLKSERPDLGPGSRAGLTQQGREARAQTSRDITRGDEDQEFMKTRNDTSRPGTAAPAATAPAAASRPAPTALPASKKTEPDAGQAAAMSFDTKPSADAAQERAREAALSNIDKIKDKNVASTPAAAPKPAARSPSTTSTSSSGTTGSTGPTPRPAAPAASSTSSNSNDPGTPGRSAARSDDESAASYWQSEKARQASRPAMNESLESTIRKVIK